MPRRSGMGGRRSSGGFSRGSTSRLFGASRSKPSSTKSSYAKAPPMSQPMPAFNVPSSMFVSRPPSLLNGLMWGVGMGAGSEIGHSAVRAISGHGKEQNEVQEEVKSAPQPQQAEYHPCASLTVSFLNCLKAYPNDIGYCQHIYKDLEQCQLKYGGPPKAGYQRPPDF